MTQKEGEEEDMYEGSGEVGGLFHFYACLQFLISGTIFFYRINTVLLLNIVMSLWMKK